MSTLTAGAGPVGDGAGGEAAAGVLPAAEAVEAAAPTAADADAEAGAAEPPPFVCASAAEYTARGRAKNPTARTVVTRRRMTFPSDSSVGSVGDKRGVGTS